MDSEVKADDLTQAPSVGPFLQGRQNEEPSPAARLGACPPGTRVLQTHVDVNTACSPLCPPPAAAAWATGCFKSACFDRLILVTALRDNNLTPNISIHFALSNTIKYLPTLCNFCHLVIPSPYQERSFQGGFHISVSIYLYIASL